MATRVEIRAATQATIEAVTSWSNRTGFIPADNISFKHAAASLNKAGIFTPTGKPWTKINLQLWLSRNGVILDGGASLFEEPMAQENDTCETPEPDEVVTQDDAPCGTIESTIEIQPFDDLEDTEITLVFQDEHTPETSQATIDWLEDMHGTEPTPVTHGLTATEVEKLRQVLAWWDEGRCRPAIGQVQARPFFKRGSPGKDTKTLTVRLNSEMIEAAKAKAETDKRGTGGTLNGLVEILIWQYLGEPPEFLDE